MRSMLQRLRQGWTGFPHAHRRRLMQAVAAWALTVTVVLALVSGFGGAAVQKWQARALSVEVTIASAPPPSVTAEAPPTPDAAGAPAGETSMADPPPRPPATVALVVFNLGLSAAVTERAIEGLPESVGLAFSPYAARTPEWMQKAAARHHDTFILLPMESARFPEEDPGAMALSSRLGDAENTARLLWVLQQAGGATGVMNLMGSLFMTDAPKLAATLGALKDKNLLFIENGDRLLAQAVAQQQGAPYVAAEVDIGKIPDEKSMRTQLAALEILAQKNGVAVGVVEAYPFAVDLIGPWLLELAQKGINLAPVSAVWKNKPHHDAQGTAPAAQPAPSQLR